MLGALSIDPVVVKNGRLFWHNSFRINRLWFLPLNRAITRSFHSSFFFFSFCSEHKFAILVKCKFLRYQKQLLKDSCHGCLWPMSTVQWSCETLLHNFEKHLSKWGVSFLCQVKLVKWEFSLCKRLPGSTSNSHFILKIDETRANKNSSTSHLIVIKFDKILGHENWIGKFHMVKSYLWSLLSLTNLTCSGSLQNRKTQLRHFSEAGPPSDQSWKCF